jgi:hypothetical protein
MLDPRWFAACLASIAVAMSAIADESPGSMHARVSVEVGGSVIKGAADDEWSFATVNTLVLPGDTFWVEEAGIAELEFPGGSFVRLADNSKTQITQIYPTPSLQGWTGSFYVHRLNRSSGNFAFQTPAGTIDVDNDSLVRVDVVGEGATTVSVRFGQADVYVQGSERVRATAGQRIYVDPGLLPSSPVPFDMSEEDDFDKWNRERVQLLVLGDQPVEAIPRTKSTPIGYSDLASYGEWVYVDNRQYWRPTTVVDYVPYRHGYWSYVPNYGHCWIGHHPFSYVTSHYGRWQYNSRYGWVWGYDDVWGPAWVASYRYGDRYFWTPIDHYGHPVHYGHATIRIGDVVISVGASSYAYSHLLHSHYRTVRPFHNDFFADIRLGTYHHDGYLTHSVPNQYIGANGIHIWNVFAGNLVNNYRPNYGSGLLVRDYTPRRAIRGITSGSGGSSAVVRARSLESTSGVNTFAQRSIRGNSARTADVSTQRNARIRSASLPSSAIRDTSEAIRRTERSRSVSAPAAVRSAQDTGGRTISPAGTTSGRDRTDAVTRGVRSGDDAPAATVRSNRTTRTATTDRSTGSSIRSTGSPRATVRTSTPDRSTATRSSDSRSVTVPDRDRGDRSTAIRSTGGQSITTRSSTPRDTTTPRVNTSPRSTSIRSTAPRSIDLPSRSSGDRAGTTRATTPRVTTSPRETTTTRSRAPERLSSPTVRSPRTTMPQGANTAPNVRTPSASSSPRIVSSPRATTQPRVNSTPRVTSTPNVSRTPRVSSPRASTPQITRSPQVSSPRSSTPSPRISSPSPRVSSPSPRISSPSPRVSSPSPRISSPSPRVSSPSPRISSPSPRVSSPSPRISSPSPRVSTPQRVSPPTRSVSPRVSAPSPRISAPSQSSSPRVSAPTRSSSPRMSAPSRSSSPRASSPSRSSSSGSISRSRSPR